MVVPSFHDSSTNTCPSEWSPSRRFVDDEMIAYVDITERLILARRNRVLVRHPAGSGDKNLTLPMRRSLFAHVPPFIIFRNNGASKLPAEITKYLLWWRRKRRAPGVLGSLVRNSGFRSTHNPVAKWCGTWCGGSASPKLKYMNVFGKVNHFPGCLELSYKESLWRNYQRMRKKFGARCFDYMPLTYVLPEERSNLRKRMQRNGGFWIAKPPHSCAGCGIKIITRFYEIPDDRSLVVQRYICWPRLIDGIKFDIRVYVLLTSVDPLRIYVYEEGLVRLATVRYNNDARTLSDKFMHLTNTSVNKSSPYFKPNDDPYKRKGNMWSLNCLWKYLAGTESVDTLGIWTKIKDIAIKTVISAEASLVNAWRKTSISTYNFYQLFGFDVLLDKQCRPWLLEVNGFPSMETDTPLCGIIKGQLAEDYLNLVGFHVPNLLSSKELRVLRLAYKESEFCLNEQLYANGIRWEDRQKQYCFLKKCKGANRTDLLKSILKNLSPDDVRVLIRHEDEAAQAGRFERIFPTRDTYKYLDFFEEIRYYNLLLDAWENEYADYRSMGIERLRKLCHRKYHLS